MSDIETTSPDVETEARSLGWVPVDQFRGDAAKWVDAETFVERGHTIMPILKATNARLQGDLAATKGRLQQLEKLFGDSQETITELKKLHDETFTARVEAERSRIRGEIKEARESGDFDAEEDAREKLAGLTKEVKAVEAAAPAPAPAPQQAQETPEYIAWKQANPWYEKDTKKTAAVFGLAQQVRAENPGVIGKAFFDKLDAEVEEMFPTSRPTSKVEGAGGRGSSGGGSSGGFSSLPPDAKQICNDQAKKFVGPARAYKTNAEWQAAYAKIYFDREA